MIYSINNGIGILEAIKDIDPEKVEKLIAMGRENKKKIKYKQAVALMGQSKYKEAIILFNDAMDYSDSESKIQECKYQYVHINTRISDDSLIIYDDDDAVNRLYKRLKLNRESPQSKEIYNYAKELSDANYKDSQSYFQELTKLRVSLIINNDADDETDMDEISKFDTFYGHIHVTGGMKGTEYKLKYKIIFPDGGILSDSFSSAFKSDNSFIDQTSWCSAYYNNPLYGATGACRFEIYDDNGTLLTSDQVRIVYY